METSRERVQFYAKEVKLDALGGNPVINYERASLYITRFTTVHSLAFLSFLGIEKAAVLDIEGEIQLTRSLRLFQTAPPRSI